PILLELGDLLVADGRPDEARSFYARAATSMPSLAESEAALALSLQEQGKLGDARLHFDRAVRIDPSSVQAAYQRANSFARTDDWDRAADGYRRVLELDPSMADAHNNLGWVLSRTGDTGSAITEWERALALRPGWTVPARNLAWSLATDADPAWRDPQRAASLMEDALRSTPQDPQLLEALAAAQGSLGDFAAARTTVRAAIAAADARGDPSTVARLRQQEARYRDGRNVIQTSIEQ
ncbi:MAG: tetratricopeptide repeat protein, partial [Candidatus Eisenbacteria bacterium]|nr:tetratricopeptide repeat protein [Candidatus Eisenbacteria bacterium]